MICYKHIPMGSWGDFVGRWTDSLPAHSNATRVRATSSIRRGGYFCNVGQSPYRELPHMCVCACVRVCATARVIPIFIRVL